MIIRDIPFQAGEELLAGRLTTPAGPSPTTGVLFLHGAGTATKERAQPIVDRLVEQYGVSSFTFDFSGHGMSSGSLSSSSLRKRIEEAKAALACSTFQQPISICAFSMGGHIALELLNEVDVRALILFYPAIYTRDAVDIPFGDPRFSATIRREQGWQDNDVCERLRRFAGNLIVIAGENDNVIPRSVIDLILSSAVSAREKQLIVLEGAPHLLLPALFQREKLFEAVCSTIAAFAAEK